MQFRSERCETVSENCDVLIAVRNTEPSRVKIADHLTILYPGALLIHVLQNSWMREMDRPLSG